MLRVGLIVSALTAVSLIPPTDARASTYFFVSQYFAPDARSAALGGAGLVLFAPSGRAWWNPAAAALNDQGWGASIAGQRLNPELIPLAQRHLGASVTRRDMGYAVEFTSVSHAGGHRYSGPYGYDPDFRDRCITAAVARQLVTASPEVEPRMQCAAGLALNRLHSSFGDYYRSAEFTADAWSFDFGALAAFRGRRSVREGSVDAFHPELRLGLRARNLFRQSAKVEGGGRDVIGRSLRVGGMLAAKRTPRVPAAVCSGAALIGDIEWDYTYDQHDAGYFGGLELEFFHLLSLRGGRVSDDADGRFGWTWGGGVNVPVGEKLRVGVDAASVPPPPIGGPRTLQLELGMSGALPTRASS